LFYGPGKTRILSVVTGSFEGNHWRSDESVAHITREFMPLAIASRFVDSAAHPIDFSLYKEQNKNKTEGLNERRFPCSSG
jgi:hypothetical protein